MDNKIKQLNLVYLHVICNVFFFTNVNDDNDKLNMK